MLRNMSIRSISDMKESDLQEIVDEIRFRPILLREQLQEPIVKTVEGFVIIIACEKDQLVKHRYAREMSDFIKENGKMREYRIGIKYLFEINKKHLMYELADDMVSKHPIAGRIARFTHPFCRQPENPQ